jgi:mitochondrial import inner membrane translocase subunit TIM44
MITTCRLGATRHFRHASAVVPFASSQGRRSGAYRHLSSQRATSSIWHPLSTQTRFSQPILLPQLPLRPLVFQVSPQLQLPCTRLLHTSPPQFQQPQPAEDIKDPPREGGKDEPKADEAKDETSEDDSTDSKKESKKEQPPPPPHGDKSPWQVFTDTLRSEFKASKEWNESTKQLASSAHQFSESESVKRARAAYDATAGAATTKTAEALKTTGKALGQGAAWTWDSKMVQGIRGGVNATGRGIEKATRPVRETKTFQSIKEAVDDGSSSRYGGWVEKEERRKKKELREQKEVQFGSRLSEKMEENPK